MKIRQARLSDRKQWLALWRAYLDFYQAGHVSEEQNKLLWQRIHTQDNPIHCLLAIDESSNEIIGFTHFFPHIDTWRKRPVCYLADLYVDEYNRGKGVASLLIKQVVEYAKEQSWHHVYWQTKHDNKRAILLYDKLTGGTNGFITYRLAVQD